MWLPLNQHEQKIKSFWSEGDGLAREEQPPLHDIKPERAEFI
jgi:hypothetical protein